MTSTLDSWIVCVVDFPGDHSGVWVVADEGTSSENTKAIGVCGQVENENGTAVVEGNASNPFVHHLGLEDHNPLVAHHLFHPIRNPFHDQDHQDHPNRLFLVPFLFHAHCSGSHLRLHRLLHHHHCAHASPDPLFRRVVPSAAVA